MSPSSMRLDKSLCLFMCMSENLREWHSLLKSRQTLNSWKNHCPPSAQCVCQPSLPQIFPAICLLLFGSNFGPLEKGARGTLFFRKITLVRHIDSWDEVVSWVQEAKHLVHSDCLFKFELSHIFMWGLPSKKILHQKFMYFFIHTYNIPKAVTYNTNYEKKVTNHECSQRRKTYCVKAINVSYRHLLFGSWHVSSPASGTPYYAESGMCLGTCPVPLARFIPHISRHWAMLHSLITLYPPESWEREVVPPWTLQSLGGLHWLHRRFIFVHQLQSWLI